MIYGILWVGYGDAWAKSEMSQRAKISIDLIDLSPHQMYYKKDAGKMLIMKILTFFSNPE